ncbi:5286_t:CDS:2 [Cetraspora pellucida]|uniref:5286_t:CDS:1 n=1 Tax=Cetraspora pellucida TaxID=1433469 RepID=A0ACA9KZ80_9GLOM|nr:5286_t:CDS:2 [Cetraspora pellucida]
MANFETLPDEIKILIFKYVNNPKPLALCSRIWSVIARDSQARAEWIIYNFGRAQALFHAIRLGPSFINLSVAQAIIARRGILSRYMIQKLLMNYGNYDKKLIELKIAHNIGQIDTERIRSLQEDTKVVNERLVELINLGFRLDYSVICDILYLFERKLDKIGNILIESFMFINKGSRETFVEHCMIESLNPRRNLTKFYVWDFLHTLSKDYSENAFKKALDYYLKNDANITVISETTIFAKLSLPLKFYEWALINFGVDSQITERCFDDILRVRANIDLQFQQIPDIEIPIGINKHVFQATCNIFKIYCNAKNFYKPSHLSIVSQCTSIDILAPLFKYYLPALFNLQITFELPMQIIEVINSTDTHYQSTFSKLTAKINKDRNILEEWNQTLHTTLVNNLNNSTNAFQNYLREFIELC